MMFDNIIMKKTLQLAYKALENNEVPIAAVIYDPLKNKIISQSYNKVETNNTAIDHAEILVIKEACKKLKTKFLLNYDIYVTLLPCPMCMSAIKLAKINRLYYSAHNPQYDLNQIIHNHKIEIYGGIMEGEGSSLLKNFFQNNR